MADVKNGVVDAVDETEVDSTEEQDVKGKATGETITIGDKVEAAEYGDTLEITVPKKIRPNGPVNDKGVTRQPGEKYRIGFTYGQIADDTEAQAVCNVKNEGQTDESKHWTLKNFVNETLKSQARANAYSRELALYKESAMNVDDARSRMIRMAIMQGVPEAEAEATVDALLKLRKVG